MVEFYNSAVSEGRMKSATEEAARLTELSALVEIALGHPLDQETFQALSSIQIALWNVRTALMGRLHSGELTPNQLLNQMDASLNLAMEQSRALLGDLHSGELTPNQLLNQMDASLNLAMEQSRALLGDERFKLIFGDAAEHSEGLINPTTFMERTVADA
jgi:hypothetical protein